MGPLTIKTQQDLLLQAQAGRIAAQAHAEIATRIAPGVTTRELNARIEEFILTAGGVPCFKGYEEFPAASCMSVNEQMTHGVPSDYVLRAGDILSIDTGAAVGGWHSDMAVTYPVGEVSDEVGTLLDVGRGALRAGISQAYPGNWVADIGDAVQRYVERRGFEVDAGTNGHGVGREVHEAPLIPNFYTADNTVLRPGMVIAIEPVVCLHHAPSYRDIHNARASRDNLCVHFEHTVAVCTADPLILTQPTHKDTPVCACLS